MIPIGDLSTFGPSFILIRGVQKKKHIYVAFADVVCSFVLWSFFELGSGICYVPSLSLSWIAVLGRVTVYVRTVCFPCPDVRNPAAIKPVLDGERRRWAPGRPRHCKVYFIPTPPNPYPISLWCLWWAFISCHWQPNPALFVMPTLCHRISLMSLVLVRECQASTPMSTLRQQDRHCRPKPGGASEAPCWGGGGSGQGKEFLGRTRVC